MEITSEKKLPALSRKYSDKLKEGFVVALGTRDNSGYHVARQRVAGSGGWILDIVSNATNRDPASQFLVTFKNKDTMRLRSFVAGGELLQINRKSLCLQVILSKFGIAGRLMAPCWRVAS